VSGVAGLVPVVELSAVERSYGQPPTAALRGVDLRVDAGELVAIVGPSGSGKSTLLQLMGTLDRPTSGSVRIMGQDLAELSDSSLAAIRAHRIGFIFQRFHLAHDVSTVDAVSDGLLYTGTRLAERRRLAIESLRRVGLGHRLDHRTPQLSGGERQRVAVARAVVGDPRLILADEPTGSLDSAAGESVIDLFHQLHEDGATVVIVTHDRELATSLPRHVSLRDGLVVGDTGAQA
jgi:putative ABC transport system ATP-binding protein